MQHFIQPFSVGEALLKQNALLLPDVLQLCSSPTCEQKRFVWPCSKLLWLCLSCKYLLVSSTFAANWRRKCVFVPPSNSCLLSLDCVQLLILMWGVVRFCKVLSNSKLVRKNPSLKTILNTLILHGCAWPQAKNPPVWSPWWSPGWWFGKSKGASSWKFLLHVSIHLSWKNSGSDTWV